MPDRIFLSQISLLTKAQWETCCWCAVPLWRTAPLLSAEFVSQWELLLLVNVSFKILQMSCKIFQCAVWQPYLSPHPHLNHSRREPSQPSPSHTNKAAGCEQSVGSDLGAYQYLPSAPLCSLSPFCSASFFAYPILHDSTRVLLFPVLAFLTSLAALVTSNVFGSWLSTDWGMILLKKFSLV